MPPRLRALSGHGGASAVLSFLIRRGGAPSGAAAFIAMGSTKVTTLITISRLFPVHRSDLKRIALTCFLNKKAPGRFSSGT